MGKAIGDILPLAIGVAISPVPISCSERHARVRKRPRLRRRLARRADDRGDDHARDRDRQRDRVVG